VLQCGSHRVENLNIVADNGNSRLAVTIPANVICLADELISVIVREWSNAISSTTSIGVMSTSCYACDTACTTAEAATDLKGVSKANKFVNFKFLQDMSTVEPFVNILSPTFEPSTKGAYGRFYFKPNINIGGPIRLYGSNHSIFQISFGDMSFGTDSVCQVFLDQHRGYKPTLTKPSDTVEMCTISGSVITLKIGKDTENVDFWVQILNMGPISYTTKDIAGNLTNFLKVI
jgi:hypothetical protein